MSFDRGASHSGTVSFQPRGIGLSEPVPYIPKVEQHADDVFAIMAALGMPVGDFAWRVQRLRH